MSRSDGGALLALAESIADGSEVDWQAAEAGATPEERVVIHQLRILSNLAGLHRSMPMPIDPTTSIARKTAAAPAIGSWAELALIERLGGGTFGEVYRAWDRHLEREVALKLLRADRADESLDSSRIANEGRLLARIRHANVVCVHGVAVHDQRVGLWMELVRGVTLEQQLTASGPFSAREAALVGIDLCRALAAIHAAGLIHRDVKAQNVMREGGGRIVLMDLGTGRDAGAGFALGIPELAGTPLYLAPEIFLGAAACARTDLYSLGVLLYHLVTGSFPVRAATVDQLQAVHADGVVTRLRDARADLPTAFVRVIDRAIAAAPAARYQSAGEFEAALLESLAESAPAVAPPVAAADRRPPGWSRAVAIAGALVVVLVATLLGWSMLRSAAPAPPAARSIHALAVLPLVNLSADNTSQDYFADGMTDELIATLATMPDVNVISHTSVMQFKNSRKTIAEIARALHVDAVLEGSVRVLEGASPAAGGSSKRVRINARLVYAGMDAPLWSRTFEAEASEVFALHRQLADAILEGPRHQAAAKAPARAVQDFTAFDLYLRGRELWNTRTRDGLLQSVDYFQQAITRDPQFAKAYAGLADANYMLGNYGAIPYAESLARAAQAAATAIELDGTLGEAYASLGVVQDNRLEWTAADASFKRAIDLNPGYSSAHHWYAAHLIKRGRVADAEAEINKALILDPLSANIQGQFATIQYQARRFAAAIAESEKTLQMNDKLVRPHVLIARAHAHLGAFDRAFESLDRAAAKDPGNSEVKVFRACILAMAGRTAEARQLARSLGDAYRIAQDGHAFDVAAIYAALHDPDRAFDWLARAREARDPFLEYLAIDPEFDPIRNDSRFETLLATLSVTK